MIRGRRFFSLAVRRPDGSIYHCHEPLNSAFTGSVRRIPLLRGVLTLLETLVLGLKALNRSAVLAGEEPEGGDGDVPGWALGLTLGLSLLLGIGIFFVLPLLLVRLIDPFIASDLVSNLIEGGLRLLILVGYIGGIGRLQGIRRVFAYHGAEHMAVHAYEAGLALTVANVRRFGTPHPRCGTAFLLTVVLVSVVVFAFLGRPDLEWRILSRILLLPVVAAVSYEIIRFSGVHPGWLVARLLAQPGLWLQRLTTRQPEDDQIEVAITAMGAAVAADAGEPYQSPFAFDPPAVEEDDAPPVAEEDDAPPVTEEDNMPAAAEEDGGSAA